MTLLKYTQALSAPNRLEVAIKLAQLALPVWNEYADGNPLTYIDTVVGMEHTVDKNILSDTIRAIETKDSLAQPIAAFDDPIVALQDGDWELRGAVLHVFYGIYNLLNTAPGKNETIFGEPYPYVSINQLIDALNSAGLLSMDEINGLLSQWKNSA